MTGDLLRLLVGAGAGLVALGLGGVLVLRAQDRQAALKRRVAAVAGAYSLPAKRPAGDAERVTPLIMRTAETGASGIARLFGHMPAREEYYPAPAPLIWAAAGVLAVLAGLLLHKVVGVLGFVAMPALWVVFCRAAYGRFNGRVGAALYAQFPDAIAMIVRTVRVGMPVTEAIMLVAREAPSPTSAEFLRAGNSMAMGVTLNEAVREMAERSGLAEYRFFATALALQSQTGGGLSETLENLAETVRKRAAARARGRALASEARTSSYILGALPLVTGGLLGLVNPGYMGLMFTHSLGQKLLALVLVLLCAGMFVMRTIISRSLS